MCWIALGELAPGGSGWQPQKWRRHRQLLEQRQPFRDFVYQTRLSDTHGEAVTSKSAASRFMTREVDSRLPRHRYRHHRTGQGGDGAARKGAAAAGIIDLVPHMIFAKDRYGHFLLANRATAAPTA